MYLMVCNYVEVLRANLHKEVADALSSAAAVFACRFYCLHCSRGLLSCCKLESCSLRLPKSKKTTVKQAQEKSAVAANMTFFLDWDWALIVFWAPQMQIQCKPRKLWVSPKFPNPCISNMQHFGYAAMHSISAKTLVPNSAQIFGKAHERIKEQCFVFRIVS